MKILKFGGTSVGSPQRMRQVANVINSDSSYPKIIVLSAVSGTTNALADISDLIKKGDVHKAKNELKNLRKQYVLFEKEFKESANTIKHHFKKLETLIDERYTIHLEKEILAQGELLSTQIFMYCLVESNINAVLLNALDFMCIDKDNEPQLSRIKQKLLPFINTNQKLYITQGYICKNEKNQVDNLQRGGSDYTASLIGAAISAKVIQIWTDIDGIHNNDPRVVKKTKPIHQLTFDEAAELAYFGAKILHPQSILPAQKANIPVQLLNTLNPKAKGTLISEEPISTDESIIKAVAAKDGIIVIKIKSGRMLLAYGFLRKIFEIFEKHKTPIDMITTSEVAVSLTIDRAEKLNEIVKDLKKYGTVEVEKNQTIICIVGNMVAEQKGIVSKVFETLVDIPIRMISYGGSKHNISLLIQSSYKKQALETLNEKLFFLN